MAQRQQDVGLGRDAHSKVHELVLRLGKSRVVSSVVAVHLFIAEGLNLRLNEAVKVFVDRVPRAFVQQLGSILHKLEVDRDLVGSTAHEQFGLDSLPINLEFENKAEEGGHPLSQLAAVRRNSVVATSGLAIGV